MWLAGQIFAENIECMTHESNQEVRSRDEIIEEGSCLMLRCTMTYIGDSQSFENVISAGT